jgi:5-methyltetrahydropteroyltriglutamate--homocysteine methyltransferase
MTNTTIVGFPRLGEFRELKFATEKYFRKESSAKELAEQGQALRLKHWGLQQASGLTTLTSNDFSFYDQTLDAATLFNIVPKQIRDLNLAPLDEYFAQARGYQGSLGDIHARPMKKWFNTNYHYLVPKFEKTTDLKVVGTKIFDEFLEAQNNGFDTRPVLVGPFTLLQLGDYADSLTAKDFVPQIIAAYAAVFTKLAALGATWIQLDEPALVKDLTTADLALVQAIYEPLLEKKGALNVLAQTYFGDVRDAYETLVHLNFDGLGLDFIEGRKTLSLIQDFGFPTDKVLFAGVVNGKNIWRNHYETTIQLLKQIPAKQLVLTTSCSLQHVPFTTANETNFGDKAAHFAYAVEKLTELRELAQIFDGATAALASNVALFAQPRHTENVAVKKALAALSADDFTRLPAFSQREKIQKEAFALPLLPTTTIGSFPQTREIKKARLQHKRGELTDAAYTDFIKSEIDACIKEQEELGLDVLVHGEFERNDMVEYFGQHLDGYLFSQNGWVQSYGTRGVKPPIIWGDVARRQAITVDWTSYAQAQTDKLVKGMLTGPVTILNWSFPREDISLKESTLQIALAIQAEVLDLEKAGIRVIQIDEAALREKLPLRQSDWYSEYLDWAIPAFRLVHSKVKPTTQIHTHMCYSEFTDIIQAIDDLDADVISFEASRSNLSILDSLQAHHFTTQVGPGVYDIHSPRIPTVAEIETVIQKILTKVPLEKVWVNPDCGLKTRGKAEVVESLQHLVTATRHVRQEIL